MSVTLSYSCEGLGTIFHCYWSMPVSAIFSTQVAPYQIGIYKFFLILFHAQKLKDYHSGSNHSRSARGTKIITTVSFTCSITTSRRTSTFAFIDSNAMNIVLDVRRCSGKPIWNRSQKASSIGTS